MLITPFTFAPARFVYFIFDAAIIFFSILLFSPLDAASATFSLRYAAAISMRHDTPAYLRWLLLLMPCHAAAAL